MRRRMKAIGSERVGGFICPAHRNRPAGSGNPVILVEKAGERGRNRTYNLVIKSRSKRLTQAFAAVFSITQSCRLPMV